MLLDICLGLITLFSKMALKIYIRIPHAFLLDHYIVKKKYNLNVVLIAEMFIYYKCVSFYSPKNSCWRVLLGIFFKRYLKLVDSDFNIKIIASNFVGIKLIYISVDFSLQLYILWKYKKTPFATTLHFYVIVIIRMPRLCFQNGIHILLFCITRLN